MNAFNHIVNHLANVDNVHLDITKDELDQFDRQFIIQALDDKRYGQAFCEYFKLTKESPLYYFTDYELARRWIIENYVV
jgi:hypothetical protein